MGTYINDCISEAYFQSKKRIPRALANLVKPKNVILKDPIALLSADWVSRVFNGNMVVLIRHPAAFASSLKRMQWGFPFEHLLAQDELINHYFSAFHNKIEFYASTNQSIVNQAAFLWVLLHTVILHFKKEHPDWVYIRHEDISRKPVENFKTLFRKLGLRYTHHVDAYIRETTRDSNPAEANDNKAHQLQRNSKANVLNWKKRLTMEEIDVVRKITDEVAYRFYGADEW
jgi:hypothetical protein